jgi:hypothetical protein
MGSQADQTLGLCTTEVKLNWAPYRKRSQGREDTREEAGTVVQLCGEGAGQELSRFQGIATSIKEA